ncbi:MAG: recombinase RecA [Thermosulfidibacteraceae bacterium]
MDKEREKIIEATISQIEKQFGKGSIMKLGEKKTLTDVQVIPTGALSLDIALGTGGVPRGRITEIFGYEASGKTTLALSIISQAQKMGGVAAFIDAEHALNPVYAQKIGVNVDELLISQPDTGEQALEIAESLVRSGAVDVIVVDSVAALVPKAELEGEMGEVHVGLQARLMSQALRKLTGVVNKSNTALIFINQVRRTIGGGFYTSQNETTTGGMALKFYASVRMEIRKILTMKGKDDTPYGIRVRVKVVKNKLAPPFKEAEFDILFDRGISSSGCIFDLAVDHGIISRSGSWFSYGEIRLGQGREAAISFLEENPKILREIEGKILERAGFLKKTNGGETHNGAQGISDRDSKKSDK